MVAVDTVRVVAVSIWWRPCVRVVPWELVAALLLRSGVLLRAHERPGRMQDLAVAGVPPVFQVNHALVQLVVSVLPEGLIPAVLRILTRCI